MRTLRKSIWILLLIVSNFSYAQQPLILNQPGTTGVFKASQSIILQPGFSTSGPFRAYISPVADDIPLAPTLSLNQNYITTWKPLVRNITNFAELPTKNIREVQQSVQYFDGLGRLMQNIQIKGSGDGSKDIVTPIQYDVLGLTPKEFLPYGSSSNNGSFKDNALTEVISYYNSKPSGQDIAFSTPYSESSFENSPLRRPVARGAAGDSWQLAAGNTIKTSYEVNLANEVKYYRAEMLNVVGDEHKRLLVIAPNIFYAAGDLYLTVTKDENWKPINGKAGTREEYKDRNGRVILKRLFNFNDVTQVLETLSTYYVYDDLGNLSFVLTPGAAADSQTPDQNNLNSWCYQYRYDHRKRLIEKRIPGKSDWESLVYNKLDQVVLTQDPKQKTQGKWEYMKYDVLGRVAMKGVFHSDLNRLNLQQDVNNNDNLWEKQDDSTTSGYTNVAFPTNNTSPLLIKYYDNYNWPRVSAVLATQPHTERTKGLETGSLEYLVDGTSGFLSVNYFNEEGEVVEAVAENHLNGSDRVVNTYAFTGELLISERTHIGNGKTTSIASEYDYDHMRRKLETRLSINGVTPIVLSRQSYNDIGKLVTKKIHSENNGADFLNTTNYEYNSRGWLKHQINPLINLILYYDDHTDINLRQFNGNISGQSWGPQSNPSLHTYAYKYDQLSRLKSGISDEGFNEIVNYNVMGNITSLTRNPMGTNNYVYVDGNQLKSISGDFLNGSYTYDENGNMTVDGTKNISFSYNHLNLPQKITQLSTSEEMTNTWLASGSKLRKVVPGLTRDYIKGIEYNNGNIEFIQTEEGRVLPSGDKFSFEYALKDHLGNTRLLLKQDGSILETSDYYPFGLQVARSGNMTPSPDNRYKYNGKELQTEFNLNQYDYGARFYDPVIGRWNVIDPLSESDRHLSPYNYARNNPLRFIDPDGMAAMPYPGALDVETYVGEFREHADILQDYEKEQRENEITVQNTDQKADAGQNHLPIPELAETTQLVDPPKGKGKKSNLPDGEVHSINASFAFGGGYSVEMGVVMNLKGESKFFVSHGPTIGFGLGLGVNISEIRARKGQKFNVADYEGAGSGYSGGIGFFGAQYSGNRTNKNYKNSDWKLDGNNYSQFGWSVSRGAAFGAMWSRTNTKFIN